MLFWAIFFYGLVAGFLLMRLRRGPRGPRAPSTLVGWTVAALSLTLGVALLLWVGWRLFGP